jgi:YidC/Oxa1 family membrane protein insertase
MQKNAIIAIILTFIVILLWGVIQQKYFPQPPAKPPIQEAKKEEPTFPVNAPDETKVTKGPEAPRGNALPAAKVIPKKDVFVETQHYWAVFTSDGARLKQFKLKKYLDSVEESPITIQLTQLVQGLLGKKAKDPKTPQPLDLVVPVRRRISPG